MDLFAYVNIGNIETLAKKNGIEIPRLRGYDLCSDMTPWTKEEIAETKAQIAVDTCRELIEAEPFWDTHAWCSRYSNWTSYLEKYYLIKGINCYGYETFVGIRWDRIHGWKRKVLKTEIHNAIKKFERYVETWNRYCGRPNVLRVHSRIGGGNWPYYFKDEKGNTLYDKPWFIEKQDDFWDSTYCDIYCRLTVSE